MAETTKPTVQLSGENGNIFSILGRCTRALRRAGQGDKAQELTAKAMNAANYDEALQIVMEYVEVE